jgi:dGTP triphosphohydrolase
MAKIQSIINKGDKILLNGSSDLVNGMYSIELLVYAALMEIFDTVDITNGKLATNPKAEEFLALLDYKIYQTLKKSGYPVLVSDFIGNYDKITENVRDLHQSLGNGIINLKDINSVKRLEVQKTIQNLTEQGMYKDFIAPVREGLYRNIMFGATVGETEQLIKSYVISDKEKNSKLTRYVKQVSTDALHQYDGSVNQVAKQSLGLNATQYVGSLIEDSRAQCMKWVGMSIIKDSELKEEIEWALNGGRFSNKKCSGMIEGTNPDNFCINRGGYFCRHRALPILVK